MKSLYAFVVAFASILAGIYFIYRSITPADERQRHWQELRADLESAVLSVRAFFAQIFRPKGAAEATLEETA